MVDISRISKDFIGEWASACNQQAIHRINVNPAFMTPNLVTEDHTFVATVLVFAHYSICTHPTYVYSQR